jgi:tRNA(fMet)-specific endonuclease VapC
VTYLLDADTCSDHLRKNSRLASRFTQYSGRLSIPTIVEAELFVWAYRLSDAPRRLMRLQELVNDVTLLPFDEACAERFGIERAGLMNRGIVVPRIDMMIASVALVHDLTLVTHNTKDSRDIPSLRLEDWISD